MVSVAGSLRAIADERTLALFTTIASERGNTEMLRNKSELSRKQYYMRISALTKAGLIKRYDGIYYISSFGKIVHSAQKLIGKAVNNYWRLKAIDSIESSKDHIGFSTEDRKKILDSLIEGEPEIRDILLKS